MSNVNLEVYPYELIPLGGFRSGEKTVRQGALLKVNFAQDLVGYADCHPWVSLGDLSLQEQLYILATGKTTPLTEESLHFAWLDAQARNEKRNLFEQLVIPPSHFLVINLRNWLEDDIVSALEQGFRYFKAKLGKDLDFETPELKKLLKLLPHEAKVRLDFNEQLTFNAFKELLDSMRGSLEKFDFFEDPFKFHKEQWQALQSDYPICLASDHDCEAALGYTESAKILVIKPAVNKIETYLCQNLTQYLVVTSYLDHPLGQICAAYAAAVAFERAPERMLPCGLLSHLVYRPNAFSAALSSEGPNLIPPRGYGFGFDELLAALPWKALSIQK